MPFFEVLTKDERQKLKEQETVDVGKLKNCFSKFKDSRGKYWNYSNDDIRWRHVGHYGHEGKGNEMVMFDLAELEEVDNNRFKAEVESQVKALVDRLPDP